MIFSKRFVLLAAACLFATSALAQPVFYPNKPATTGELLQRLRKLNVLGTALYVAAHPDDENTLMLTYLANERNLRTGYLSLTRGDGGQNLIGAEQGVDIGLIRTQELLAARRVDGAEQFFSRAYDFGFSKSTDEAVRVWGRDQVLGDVVWAIRRYQPDVIITRFPPDARAGHGHHSASAALAEEAFKIANDPTRFPEQLRYVRPWQAKRIFWNTYNPNQFNSTKRPNEPGLIGVETGLFNPRLGQSYGEIAAQSRSQHKSQGFGVSANRGQRMDYLQLKDGEPVNDDFLNGVDATWSRIPGSGRAQALVTQAIATFNPNDPAALVPTLVSLYQELGKLDARNTYVAAKRQEVETLIQQCLGLFFEANPAEFAATPGERVAIRISAVNRSAAPIKWISLRIPQTRQDSTLNVALAANDLTNVALSVALPDTLRITQPYWLDQPGTKGLFNVANQQLIGRPENLPALTAEWTFEVAGQRFTFSRPWQFKETDPVQGELYRPFEVRPTITARVAERVYPFATSQPDAARPKTVDVAVQAQRSGQRGSMRLDVPAGWRVTPATGAFALANKGDVANVSFTLTPDREAVADGTLRVLINEQPARDQKTISYPHIPPQTRFPLAEARVTRLDLNVTARRVGYIVGAGDDVPAALRQMGCTVTLLDEAATQRDLSQYQAIVLGVRAYNTQDWLKAAQPRLMEYVRNGGTLLVQYNTSGESVLGRSVSPGPFPFVISRERVTEEDAPVTFLNPQSPLLATPNKITPADFNGWVQERGLYFAQDWDKAYEPLFSMNDSGEAAKQGSLLVARYGKGTYIFTGLAFFRQLPAGVPGAFRLFANLISAGQAAPSAVGGGAK